MRKSVLLILISFFLMPRFLFAQETNPLEKLISEALVIKITARTVSENNSDNNWQMETSFITIPGRQIKLALTGNNIDINAFLTPYKKESGQVLLIAQGEMWINETDSDVMRYYSDMKNVNIKYGEKITYYPLGYDNENFDGTNIELDIQLFKYKDYLVQLSKSDKEISVVSE